VQACYFFRFVRLDELDFRDEDADFTAFFTREPLTFPLFGAGFTVRRRFAPFARVRAASDFSDFVDLGSRSLFAAVLKVALLGVFFAISNHTYRFCLGLIHDSAPHEACQASYSACQTAMGPMTSRERKGSEPHSRVEVPGTQYSTPGFRTTLPRAKDTSTELLEMREEGLTPKGTSRSSVPPKFRERGRFLKREVVGIGDVGKHVG